MALYDPISKSIYIRAKSYVRHESGLPERIYDK
jgi:hypothetical protein